MYQYHGHSHFFVRSLFDNKVLTVDGHHADSRVIVHHRMHPAEPRQLWRFEPLADDHFLIISAVNPQLVLTVAPMTGAELIVHHRVHPPTPNQIFEWHGGHHIRSHLGEDLVMEIKHHSTSDYAKVDINRVHGGESQRWEVDRSEYYE